MVNPHLPQPDTLRCQQISIEPDLITITIESMAPQGIYPLCGRSSSREHSRYKRQLSDLPWQGRAAVKPDFEEVFLRFPGLYPTNFRGSAAGGRHSLRTKNRSTGRYAR